MVEYLLSIFNSTELIALGIKNASESTIFERILEFLSENSLITGITSMLVFLLGLLIMVVQKCFQDCCAKTFEWLITQVKEAFVGWWDEKKALLFSLAKETFLILLRRGLFIELEKIKVKMNSVHDKLKNADIRADKQDDNAKKSVEKMVDIIYNFEAAYDRYQLLQETPETPEYSSNIWRCWVFILKKLWVLKVNLLILETKISIAFSVAKVNQELVELETSDSNHQVAMEEESKQQYQRPPNPPPENQLVGLQAIKADLIHKLKAGNERKFIVVTGEPGVGKTTLVETVYLDYEVTSYFQLRAFVTVSRTYRTEEVLEAICDQLKVPQHKTRVDKPITIMEIVHRIRTYLETSKKRYIIVLDDVWGNDYEFSDCINKAFPHKKKGSGILMTMRGGEHIAGHWTATLIGITYHVYPLSDIDAQRLFCMKVVHSKKGEYSTLLPLILQKCGNIPLLIGAVAAILAQKDVSRWKTVIDDFGIVLRKDSIYKRIKKIFLYSYHDLSSYELQQCFLYFSMFPQYSQIYIHTLVHIWVAEGFIKPTSTNYTVEERAENLLNELIHKGLVILGYKEKKSYHAMLELRETFVRVHDIFHEIILQKLEDLEFCQVLPKASSSEILNKPFHRLSMNNIGDTNLHLDMINTGTFLNWDKSILGNSWIVRSVLSFKNKTFPNFPKTSIICLLRVLLLEHYQNYDFPEVVSSMCNLRFLSLTHHKIMKIPEFICKLLNLETLEIKHTSSYFCYLPKEMSMLKKLRHLLLSIEVQIPEGVLKSLTALQTLDEIEGKLEYILEELKHLTQLRRLAIVYVDKNYDLQFSEALQEMRELRFLSMCWSDPMSPPRQRDIYHRDYSPEKLENIVLWGDIGRYSLPGWIGRITELRSLSLELKRSMTRDTNETIQELIAALTPLENLEHLYLRTDGIQKFDFGTYGFGRLKYLRIRDFDLISITGSLPTLSQLDLMVLYPERIKPNLPPHLERIAVISYVEVK
ncbi:unnamed protein product [Amaranthus hypochondriacus]